MVFPSQDIAALTLVSLAAGYLGLRGWRLFGSQHGDQGCSSCGGCSGGPTNGSSLVSLKLPEPSRASEIRRST